MRRTLMAALAAPALLLAVAACGSDEPGPAVNEPTSASTTEDATSETTSEETTSEEMTSEETTSEEMTSEETTSEDDGNAAGDEGAVADRTEEWLVAFVSGDEAVCDYMLDLSSDGAMKDSDTDYELCKSTIPGMAADMFPQDMVGIIESIEIDGATIDGDTATVGKDNFSETFAEGFGDKEINLKKVDGEWYVDLQNSFQ